MPMSTGRAAAGSPPSETTLRLAASNSARSTTPPGRNSVAPESMIVTRRSICRTMTSMCLSWIDTPCDRYTFCTWSTRCSCTSRGPITRSTSCGSAVPSSSCWPTPTWSPSCSGRSEPSTGDRGEPHALGQLVVDDLLAPVVRDEGDLPELVAVLELDAAVDVGDRRLALRDAGLEELLHTRQTRGDVLTRDATGVEGAHRQLRAGLTDGLGGDDADRLADVDELAGGQRAAVAARADTLGRVAGQDAADPDLADARARGGRRSPAGRCRHRGRAARCRRRR